MTEEIKNCPYCQKHVEELEKHLELEHEELTMQNFFYDSKKIILTGSFLLLSLLTLVIDLEISILGLHISRILMGFGILSGGIPLAKSSFMELVKERTFDVDGLVVVASLGAVSIGY